MFQDTDGFEPDADQAAGEVIDGEAIIINLGSGVYYSMQGIGGEIWSMITEGHSFGSMIEQIVGSYEVAAPEARTDLESILEQLVADNLVRVLPRAAYGSSVLTAGVRKAYVRPLLQVYRDMEDLLALDPPAPGMKQISWKGADASSRNGAS